MEHLTSVENPTDVLSKLDLKAPGKARREYVKGFQLLMRKELPGAIEHLGNATRIYPQFVAAHNALGSAYLNRGQNEEAHEEFENAVSMDDHVPASYLNLGCAELALKQYGAAEESLQKASALAPLDISLKMTLAYSELLNHDYAAVVTTAGEVHEQKHQGSALIHYYAASAWESQGNHDAALGEMGMLMSEDPKSESAPLFQQVVEQIKARQSTEKDANLRAGQGPSVTYSAASQPTAEEALIQAQAVMQAVKERNQIAQANAEPDTFCTDCSSEVATSRAERGRRSAAGNDFPGFSFLTATDEVAVFFAATEHGRSATNLNLSDIDLQDDGKPPQAILSFRNESQLPLRLGLIIDTSNSITKRFAFEQAAATKFLQTVVSGKDDLAFVVGVNNSVLLAQDFTADQSLTARAVNELAPGGGTALWDAVSFAARKLGSRVETEPVARLVVVISDGEDNSSQLTLKQSIAAAQRNDIAVYTVSTADGWQEGKSVGDNALETLANLSGGTSLTPGSVRGLSGSLSELQELIRGRYLVSYKPATFQRDGRYRKVVLNASQNGRKLRVYSRKGYYASPAQVSSVARR
ncbi:MAG TPA: VWA domain-containing protein [Candidatus Binatia bacterium]|nr:VWA domain-containing protein [Candidatus Binatia bacterium]